MTNSWSILLDNASLLALWGALVIHWFFPIPTAIHPIHICQRFAILLADKVNNPNDNYKQRLFSGTLTWALIWATLLILLIALYQLVWVDVLFQLTLLWIALDWRNTAKLSQHFINAYAKEDKVRCRQLLEYPLNRNTQNLSLLGLGKAGAETQLLSYGRLVAGVLFWYAIAGGIGAIMYRVAICLARAWSPSRHQYNIFGLPAVRILAMLDIIPLRILALLITVGNNSKVALQGLIKQGEHWFLPGPGWLLSATGHKLSLSLGGPAIYDNKKMVRPQIGGKIAPAAFHLAQIKQMMTHRLLAWVIIESALLFIFQGSF
ncbi:adenosylcobinamide-phosphate synthase [Photobacterium frigidiphilum]|uniref:Adenosylcobinamide-phosphate synthase n=1 Tax=Photobacterium frigidiphilum TaxID=264736 RepID=A0A2T3JB87_9GAMM|nr:cobalamin biosynthesis family protein [Photobacterium frigidiphilum]PSU46112.1 adenosylcobinamide-phosphate synthase [Photobacterium frigidiphilum]